MTTRKYQSRSQQTTLTSAITSTATTMVVGNPSALVVSTVPAGQTYSVVIDPDTALEEIVDVSDWTSGTTLTITRGVENGGTGFAHSPGAVIRHMLTGRDLREANTHIEGTLAQHAATTSAQLLGIISDETGSGSLVFATSPTLVTPVLGAATATTINGTAIPTSATLVKTSDTGTVTSTMILDGTIVNDDISASAAIGYSKLALTGTITSSDITNDTIVNADIKTNAAIDWTKLGISSTVSSTEIGYVDGVTSAIQTQIDSKLATATASSTYAPLASPTLTGIPAAPTASAATNTTQIATTAYVRGEITALIGGAPTALDTLTELAAALANDASYSTTITTALATKLPLAGGTMSGAIAMGTNKITGLGTPTVSTDAATKAYADSIVATSPSNLTGPITSVGSATAIASQTGTGTKFVVDTSPTLVTPVLGVATATSINGTTIPSTKTLVVTTDKLSALAATTSAELAGVISDETGTGALVFATSPTLITPALGVATATSINATTIPSTKTLVVTTDTLAVHAATTSAQLAGVISDETGSGALVFGTSPTISGLTLTGSLTAAASTGTSGYVLSSTGTGVQWITAPSGLPSQTSNSGKYLTTDGSNASWAAITTDPNPQIFMLMGA